ncbi:MAG: folate-binding protein YgfZ [Alphaproteobacteria bacterium]|nr:folate-binding protein YgfZ [Alphaproteobacteria bacterium]
MSTIKHLADRAVVRITGEDRRPFLQGLVTQDIDQVNEDNAGFAALLTPQGKILFDFMIAERDGAFLIDCDKDAAPALVKRLTLYKLRAKVTINIDETLEVMTSQAPPAPSAGIAFPDPRLPKLGWRIIAPKGDGAIDDDYDRKRIALGVPECGRDFNADEIFPLDVNYDALNGVSYAKGCFVGQEVASRMKRKSEVRKRTIIAEFDGPAPEKGAAITAGDFTLGQVMSTADTTALALIRLDRWGKSKAAGANIECETRSLRLHVPDYLKQD